MRDRMYLKPLWWLFFLCWNGMKKSKNIPCDHHPVYLAKIEDISFASHGSWSQFEPMRHDLVITVLKSVWINQNSWLEGTQQLMFSIRITPEEGSKAIWILMSFWNGAPSARWKLHLGLDRSLMRFLEGQIPFETTSLIPKNISGRDVMIWLHQVQIAGWFNLKELFDSGSLKK